MERQRIRIMYVTAEAVFAEIHAYFSSAVNMQGRKNVFIASPTTFDGRYVHSTSNTTVTSERSNLLTNS